MSHCDVNDTVLKQISKGCPKMSTLSIRCCENVTDAGFSLLAACKQLYRLDVSQTEITDEGLSKIAASCPMITHLCVQGSSVISATEVFRKSRRRHLQAHERAQTFVRSDSAVLETIAEPGGSAVQVRLGSGVAGKGFPII